MGGPVSSGSGPMHGTCVRRMGRAAIVALVLLSASCAGVSSSAGLSDSSSCSAYNQADSDTEIRWLRAKITANNGDLTSGSVDNAAGTVGYTCANNPDKKLGSFSSSIFSR